MNLAEIRGWRRQRETIITPNATAALADTSFAPLGKSTILTAAQWKALQPYAFEFDGSLTHRIGFFMSQVDGSSANNKTCDYQAYLVTPAVGWDRMPTKEAAIEPWFAGSLVAGTVVGSAGSKFLLDSEYWCDQISATLSGVATTVKGPAVLTETAMSEGNLTVYQATVANNDLAHIIMPSNGRRGAILFDFYNPSASTRVGFAVASSGL